MIGKTVNHYEILQQLGAGGMGIVYRARDSRLDRDVALKFLPEEWGSDWEAKQRFQHEARAASGLDHENICAIYDIGETDEGQLYIAMPFYRGQTLKYVLKAGRIDPERAIGITRQLLSALAAAHEAGIVHRDIKPDNVMLTERGQVKLLDFGIAKLETTIGLTRAGATLGTTSYMSPEQARGETVDARTDLWSVGVILYEMLTGTRPFTADYEQAVIYSILNSDPPAPHELDRTLPEGLSSVVMQLLSKDRSGRPPSAADAIERLETTAIRAVAGSDIPVGGAARESRPGPPVWPFAVVAVIAVVVAVFFMMRREEIANSSPDPSTRRAIAVVPFSNLRADPETDYLGYALADQVIGSLAYVSNVLVRPSTSIRQYEGRTVDPQTIGEELSVDYVVAGNYLRQDERMRLTIEMVDVASNEMIWREPIEVEYENAFELQDLVSDRILERLEVTFSSTERSRMRAGIATDPVAYELYLKAIAQPITEDGTETAIDMAQRAIDIDSTFAPAWNERGFRLGLAANFYSGGGEVARRGVASLEQAVELNPYLLDALGNLSIAKTETGESAEGLRLANRILEINPQSALGHFARGYALRYGGMAEESAVEMRRALTLDSTDTRFRQSALTFYQVHSIDEIVWAARRDHGESYGRSWQGLALLLRGRTDEAEEYLQIAASLDPDGLIGLWSKALLGVVTGDHEAGFAAAQAWEEQQLSDPETNFTLALVYCANGYIDNCVESLSRAVERGYYACSAFNDDPFLKVAQSDLRFDVMLNECETRHKEFTALVKRSG